jgi:hypothetical protein
MKISVANTKTQLIQTLELIINDWQKDGVIQSLITYCNNSTEFPYSQLRKMEKMGSIRSLSSSKRNKTYEWRGDAHPNLEQIAQSIINYTGKTENQNFKHLSTSELSDGEKRSALIGFLRPGETKRKEEEQKQDKDQPLDLTKLTIKIALILQKNGVSEDKIEPITASILSLLE